IYRALVVLRDARIEADRPLTDGLEDKLDLLDGEIELGGDLRGRGLLRTHGTQFGPRRHDLLRGGLQVSRQANRPPTVDHRAPNGVLDPPARVGREAEATGRIEAVDRLHQADVPLLDAVVHRQAGPLETVSDADDQPEIRLGEAVAN